MAVYAWRAAIYDEEGEFVEKISGTFKSLLPDEDYLWDLAFWEARVEAQTDNRIAIEYVDRIDGDPDI